MRPLGAGPSARGSTRREAASGEAEGRIPHPPRTRKAPSRRGGAFSDLTRSSSRRSTDDRCEERRERHPAFAPDPICIGACGDGVLRVPQGAETADIGRSRVEGDEHPLWRLSDVAGELPTAVRDVQTPLHVHPPGSSASSRSWREEQRHATTLKRGASSRISRVRSSSKSSNRIVSPDDEAASFAKRLRMF